MHKIQTEHRNPQYLTQYPLPFNLGATTDPAKALDGCSYIVHSVPVQASKGFLQDIKASFKSTHFLLDPPSISFLCRS